MKFEDIENILRTSNPKEWLYNIDDGVYTYKPDVKLNIRTKHPDDPHSDRKFEEDWVNKFPSKEAWKLIAKVYYSGSFVKSYFFVSADGDRIIISVPKTATELEITPFQYNMGQILNYRNVDSNLGDYEPRFRMSGFEVK